MFICQNWRHSLEDPKGKKVIIVGIPGVGKSTIISNATTSLQNMGTSVTTVVFGSLMFEEAKKYGSRSYFNPNRIDSCCRYPSFHKDNVGVLSWFTDELGLKIKS